METHGEKNKLTRKIIPIDEDKCITLTTDGRIMN